MPTQFLSIDGNPPDDLICPITHEIMTDPVIITGGQTFERSALLAWFKKCEEENLPRTHPFTRKVLKHIEIIPNLALKSLIDQWNKTHVIGLEEIGIQTDTEVKVAESKLNDGLKTDQSLSSNQLANFSIFHSAQPSENRSPIVQQYIIDHPRLLIDGDMTVEEARVWSAAIRSNKTCCMLEINLDKLNPICVKIILHALTENRTIYALNLISVGPIPYLDILANILERNYALINISAQCSNENLLKKIVSLVQRNENLGIKFFEAVANNDFKTVNACIEQGVSVYVPHNANHDTALHYAVFYQRKEIVALLLSHMKNRELRNDMNLTAYALAPNWGIQKLFVEPQLALEHEAGMQPVMVH